MGGVVAGGWGMPGATDLPRMGCTTDCAWSCLQAHKRQQRRRREQAKERKVEEAERAAAQEVALKQRQQQQKEQVEQQRRQRGQYERSLARGGVSSERGQAEWLGGDDRRERQSWLDTLGAQKELPFL